MGSLVLLVRKETEDHLAALDFQDPLAVLVDQVFQAHGVQPDCQDFLVVQDFNQVRAEHFFAK